MHGTQRDLLPGEPNLAPLTAVLLEAYVGLVRKLHSSTIWTKIVNKTLLAKLNKITELFPQGGAHNELAEAEEPAIQSAQLCAEVWPALIVIGGTAQRLVNVLLLMGIFVRFGSWLKDGWLL